PGVYAAGDVAEWQGRVYGIVPAAREQALVAAQNMVEPQSARYQGTNPAQRLKVADIDLLVIGDSQPMNGPHAEKRVSASGRYVKLVLDEKRHLIGAIVLGYPELVDEVNQLFHERRVIPETFPPLL
ncbi:MAG: NAD(P)/FAD-dependent oxidoreductase, partial [Candidatus Bathyarchaeia archaeon]